MSQIRVLVFPKDDNPYQGLLYGAMRRLYGGQLKVTFASYYPVVGALLLPITLIIRRLQGCRILHIHWPRFVVPLRSRRARQIASEILFYLSIRLAGLLGYRLVWTVHNILPHEAQTTDDRRAAAFMASKVHAKVIHSPATAQQLADAGVDNGGCHVIPHGTYVGSYPDNVTDHEARHRLGIPAEDFVLLFFGLVRPYKGVDELLVAFQHLNLPSCRLIIAGKCEDAGLADRLSAACLTSNVAFVNCYIAQGDVATYFHAADLVCLPFRASTTSGSALLAMSFARPVVAPRMGALADLPDRASYLYDPAQGDVALETMIREAHGDLEDRRSRGRAAKTYADGLSWESSAALTYDLYRKLWPGPLSRSPEGHET